MVTKRKLCSPVIVNNDYETEIIFTCHCQQWLRNGNYFRLSLSTMVTKRKLFSPIIVNNGYEMEIIFACHFQQWLRAAVLGYTFIF